MKAYEIHTFKEGVWKIDSVFDDRALALHEASKVDEGRRYMAVRVIEENYDETSDLTTTRTIFRGKSGVKKTSSPAPAKEKRPVNHGRRGAGGQGRRNSRPPQRKKSSVLVPVLILMIILFAGLAAMLLLQQVA